MPFTGTGVVAKTNPNGCDKPDDSGRLESFDEEV